MAKGKRSRQKNEAFGYRNKIPQSIIDREEDHYNAPIDSVDRLVAELHRMSPEAREAVGNIQKILDASPLSNEQKREAIKRAAKELGVPLSMEGRGSLTIGGVPTTTDAAAINAPIRRHGNIHFDYNEGKIPTVTGGKSPAMDFTHALMEGNPEAVRLAQEATGGDYDLVQGPGQLAYQSRKVESLADLLLAATYQWPKHFHFNAKQEKAVQPIINHYRQSLRQAHRFQLDNDFTQYATEVSNNTKPEKLLYRLQFATLPYETCWLEFNLHVKVRTMRRYHGLDGVPEGVSPRMGILLKRIDETAATVEMIGEMIGGEVTAPTLHGYIYSLDERNLVFNRKYNGLTPFTMHRRAAMLNKKDPYWQDLNDPKLGETIDKVSHGALWGYSEEGKGGIVESENLLDLACPPFLLRHGEIAFSPFYDFFEQAGLNNFQIMQEMSQTMDREIAEFTGMGRWLVTVLALLNQAPIRTEHVQPSHMVRAGLTRRLPAFDHHKITLKVPKTKPVPYLERHLANVERKHRAHMVRGHWRVYVSEQPCGREEHEWETDWEAGYRLCGKCMSFSRLVHEHKRGDESLGWVHAEYRIKKGG